ncbi:NUDIX hydrolase [Actinoplanes palleronii]|uniref:Nudix hydrolase domain-containing protein n=1 Tax=Actinoplanes palleronii TaxID=113570 RepID=A0ABQ4BJM6_9ACTN|nr:NUDIX domain-containing protein [Actinoplanes palleronii]GIE70877.1 hypothetical protein Apa02nite_069850 [Actinoplanes palleronii]
MVSPRHPVDVLLLLRRDDQVLLALRDGTGYADGQWNLPSGKLEFGEDAVAGIIREAYEEIGITLAPAHLRLATTIHHRSSAEHARIGLAFAATFDPGAHGEPLNAEPHKCAKIAWFPAGRLPPDTYPYSAACVRAMLDTTPFVLSGWDD